MPAQQLLAKQNHTCSAQNTLKPQDSIVLNVSFFTENVVELIQIVFSREDRSV